MLTNLFGKERGECLELADIALVEREQQLLDPVVFRAIERVQDWVHELWSRAPIEYRQSRPSWVVRNRATNNEQRASAYGNQNQRRSAARVQ